MTSYQGNGSNIAATVTTCNKLAKATGGAETSTTTALTASTTGWVQIFSQGTASAQTGAGSEPTITDSNNHGWMQDDSTFDGQTFATGNWTPAITLHVGANTITADIHCLILKRPSGGGTYTIIGDLVKSAQTIGITKATFAFSASSLTGPAFATGDRLCIVWLLNITSGNAGASPITCYMSTSASTGVASDAQIASPGFSPSITTSTRTVPMTAALLSTSTRTVPMTASVGPPFRTVPLSAALLATESRTVPLSAALNFTSTRSVPLSGALLATFTRTVPMSAALTVPGPSSGGFCLYASGTGVASFDDFRATAYPDPSLALEPIGRLGTSVVSWNAILPSAATTLSVFTSLRGDGTDWVDVSQQSGGAIPGLYNQPDPTVDDFAANSSSGYTSTNRTSGALATWTYDTTNSRIVATGGTNGLYLNASLSRADVDLLATMDRADSGGLVWRFVDQNNYYALVVGDNQASVGTPNTATLYSIVGNVQTQLAQASLNFVRGTFHSVRVLMLAGVITATFDGAALFTYTDPSPLAAGNVGLYNNGGSVGSRYYQLWIQPQGDVLTNKYVYTKEALATTDPTVTPQVLDRTVAAFDPSIGAGALIPSADYRDTFLDKNFDDLVKQSGDYSWVIDQNLKFSFRKRTLVPAPWVLYSAPFGLVGAVDLEADGNLQVTVANDLYRNRQKLTGVIGLITASNTFAGNGTTTSFPLSYGIAPGTQPQIVLNGTTPQAGAPKGQTGSQWYYDVVRGPGGGTGPTLAQDSGGTVLATTDTLTVTYTGAFITTIVVDNVAAQQALAQVEGGTGIVEAVEDVSRRNMLAPAAVAYAGSLLSRFCIPNARTIQFMTRRSGLAVGQIQSVFVPEENLWDAQMLITGYDQTVHTQPSDTIVYDYLVTASELPPIGSWSKLLGAGIPLS